MRRCLILLSVAAAVGCDRPTPARPPSRPAGHYLYVVDSVQGQISAFRLDEHTGALSVMGDSQWILGLAGMRQLTMAPDGMFGFLGTAAETIPLAYAPDKTFYVHMEAAIPGALPVAAVHPSGRFLYASSNTGLAVRALGADGIPGKTPVASYSVNPTELSIDVEGRHLLSLNKQEGLLDAFEIDQATGRLTNIPESPKQAANVLRATARVHPNGLLLFALSPGVDASHMEVFVRTADTITPVVGSPFVLARDARAFAFSPDGRHLFVTHKATHIIAVYAIDDAGGMHPVAGSPFNAATDPDLVEVDPGGRFLYITYPASGTIAVFAIADTGSVSPVPGTTTRTSTKPRLTPLMVPPPMSEAASLPSPDSPALLAIDTAPPQDPDHAERLAAANAPPTPTTYPPEPHRKLRLACMVTPDGGESGVNGPFVSNLRSIHVLVDVQGMPDALPPDLKIATGNQASQSNNIEITALPLAVSNNPSPSPLKVTVSETSEPNQYGLRLGLLVDIPMPEAYVTKSVNDYVDALLAMKTPAGGEFAQKMIRDNRPSTVASLKTAFKENQTGPFELTCTYRPKGAALDKVLTAKTRMEVLNRGRYFEQPAFALR